MIKTRAMVIIWLTMMKTRAMVIIWLTMMKTRAITVAEGQVGRFIRKPPGNISTQLLQRLYRTIITPAQSILSVLQHHYRHSLAKFNHRPILEQFVSVQGKERSEKDFHHIT